MLSIGIFARSIVKCIGSGTSSRTIVTSTFEPAASQKAHPSARHCRS